MRPALRPATLGAVIVAALMGVAACGTTADTSSRTPAAAQAPAAQPAAVQSAADPAKLVDCTDGQSQVASFKPARPDPASYFSDGTIAKIRSRGQLIVGTSGDVRLWGARDPITTKPQGYDIDLVTKIAQRLGENTKLGVKVVYKVINYGDRIPDLQNGSVNIVAHTMTINCDRWSKINFSTEYYDAGQRILVRYDPQTKEPDHTDVKQLGGKTVCAGSGSTNVGNIQAVSNTLAAKINIVQEADLGDCLVRFQLGEVDAITGDDTVLAGFAAQDPYSEVVGAKFSAEPYGLGFNKDDRAFTEYVNLLLEGWRSDGTLARLGKTWMKDEATAVPPATYGRTSNPGPVS